MVTHRRTLPRTEGLTETSSFVSQDLHHSLGRLVKRLLPWQPEERVGPQSDSVKVEDVMLVVDMLLEETSPDDKAR